jgi:2-aminoethylphosphonate-pyruvate transaminase
VTVDASLLPENPYLLLTAGPLSTTKTVKAAMLSDRCTWDDEYHHEVVQFIREELLRLAGDPVGYTAVLLQGSGTFAVEAAIGTVVPEAGKLLVLANGAYGERVATIARTLDIDHQVQTSDLRKPIDLALLERTLQADSGVTHVAMVHCETSSGILNPVAQVGRIVRDAGRQLVVDAVSSFGGVPMQLDEMVADIVIGSPSACLQGVPGFSFVIAREAVLAGCGGRARSLSLDLHEQWRTMESGQGRWRFGSPGHVLRACAQALRELQAEGGVAARQQRYRACQQLLVIGMRRLGFESLLEDRWQSPIVTAFLNPRHPGYDFQRFYVALKSLGFVIYPSLTSDAGIFRIGTIGDVHPGDIERLLVAVGQCIDWV